jgi:cobalt-zinc-cadmium efflux system outer membrane protein
LRQPEARSLDARQAAADARREAAGSWTPEPVAVELSSQSDRFNSNLGGRETAAGLAIPLWLPGERARAGELAHAESLAVASRKQAAQLRTAALVREAWWNWHRARLALDLAQGVLDNARQLAADVGRRVKAGDLARSDQHQSDGAVASAEAAVAEAEGAMAGAVQQFAGLTGLLPSAGGEPVTEPVPDNAAVMDPAAHPAIADLMDRAEVARRLADLAGARTRGAPELTVGTTRERGAVNEAYRQSLTVGIRIPFGADSRYRAAVSTAQADAIEAESLLGLERQKLAGEAQAAGARLTAARTQAAAADRRAQLARESQGFFQKSFRLGESDLPTRLRIELEAADAARQAARARIDLAASISALRQTLGLLPQ